MLIDWVRLSRKGKYLAPRAKYFPALPLSQLYASGVAEYAEIASKFLTSSAYSIVKLRVK